LQTARVSAQNAAPCSRGKHMGQTLIRGATVITMDPMLGDLPAGGVL
jgi:hypothetical protein